jgi:hypothetical protein
MKNPVCEQIQSRNVKGQLRMQQYAQRVNGNVIIMNTATGPAISLVG